MHTTFSKYIRRLSYALSLLFLISLSHTAQAKPGGGGKNTDKGGSAKITIHQHPVSVQISGGESASFYVEASANKGPGLKYQWFLEGASIVSATSSTLLIDNASADQAGAYFVRVMSGDRFIDSNVALLTVEQPDEPVNSDPIALNDSATTQEDVELTLTPLSNDSDIDGDALAVNFASALTGAVSINPDHTLSYRPPNNFSGADTVTYSIHDGRGGSAVASIHISITAVNDAPVAANDILITDEDLSGTVDVLQNDLDVDSSTLTISSASASNGDTTINPDGTITYTPITDYNGSDIIYYTVSDTEGAIDNGIVEVTVNAVDDLSISYQPTSASIYAGETHTLNVSAVGSGDIYYQWFKDGYEISGATQSYLTISSASELDSGTYAVIVSDNRDAQVSQNAIIEVKTKPRVQVSWNAPEYREDGTLLLPSEIAHFNIYYYAEDGSTAEQSIQVSGDNTSYEIEGLDPAHYVFWIRTVDIEGFESSASEYIQVAVQ